MEAFSLSDDEDADDDDNDIKRKEIQGYQKSIGERSQQRRANKRKQFQPKKEPVDSDFQFKKQKIEHEALGNGGLNGLD